MNNKVSCTLAKLTMLGYFFLTLFWSSILYAQPSIASRTVFERFAGMVVDNEGKPLVSTKVSVNGIPQLTDTRGFFEIYAARNSRYVINASKTGYASNSVIESKAIGGNAALQIKLSPAYTVQFDPTKEVTLSDSPSGQGTQIKLPANALVNDKLQSPSSSVFVSMRTYDLATEEMPGDFSAINKNGAKVALETAGAFWAEFSDAAGVKYNLRPGTQASISIPAVNLQSTVGLWSYDEQTGLWKEEGQASLVNGRFEGKVSHFSSWNFDWEKATPSCVKVTVEQSLINKYGFDNKVLVKALVITDGGQTRTVGGLFDSGNNALYNLPNNATIQFFVPANSDTPYATVNSGGAWGDVGNPLSPPSIDKTSQCKGSITLAYPPPTATSVDGYACISGDGKGLGFSWMLKSGTTIVAQNSNAVTPVGNSTLVANSLMSDIYNKSNKTIDLSSETTSSSGEFCFAISNYQLFVGKPGQTDSSLMCAVSPENTAGCQFNPLIRWISKFKRQTSINGRVWNDINGNGLFDTNETPVSGWRVFIRKPNGAELMRVTDANGFYEFSSLYNRGNHIIFGENRTTHTYTTPNSVTRNINFLIIQRPVNFGVRQIAKFTLSVSKAGNGTGTVASAPAGISCGTDCTEAYALNTNVQLTATPDATSVFSSWTGACSGTNPVVTVAMTASKNCVANFVVKSRATLSVSKVGTGTVASTPAGISCGTDCTEDYALNTNVQLTATTDATSVFSGWTGACSGTNPVVTVSMTASKNCVAKFGPKVKPILVLEPVLPSKVCKGQPFEVTFAADSTKTVGEMQAWLTFTPTTSVSVVSATSLIQKVAAPLDFGSLGNVVFRALRANSMSAPAINLPIGKTNLFKVVFLAKDAGLLNLSFSNLSTWSKTINEYYGFYEVGLPDPLTQTNLAAQIVVDSCL